jgi:catechol 2,3-dioxygenase-like lactoylglutathione lyase family enzyme
MLKGVDHMSFAVSDLDRSLEFYRDLLGLEVSVRRVWREEYVRKMVGIPDASLDIALLKLPGEGALILELIEYENPKGIKVESHPNTPGNTHICFLVEDIWAIYDRLQQAGVKFVSEPVTATAGPNQGRQVVYVRDPDDILVQLMQP